MAIVRICRSMLGSIRRPETELLQPPPKKKLNLNIQFLSMEGIAFLQGKIMRFHTSFRKCTFLGISELEH